MAALSGLSTIELVSNATTTWSDLVTRQQRIVSSLGGMEKRIEAITKKCEQLGIIQTNRHGPVMTGPEWIALAQRQQTLLQSICHVKDRCKALGFSCGITNPAYEESVAKPQLLKKVPSHFNNDQLADFLLHDTSSPPNTSLPFYPLNKLLVMILVRDLHRFVACGAHRPIMDRLKFKSPTPTISTTSASTASTSSSSPPHATSTAIAKLNPPDHSLFQFLLGRLIFLLTHVTLTEQELTHLVVEGEQLLILSSRCDTDTRHILNCESYLLGQDNLQPSSAFTAALNAFRTKQARSWFTSGVSPFANYKFTRPPAKLREAKRVACPQCQRLSSLYCPYCLVLQLPEHLKIPPVKLPLHVDIVHHVGENVKKSTSIHGCVLSPEYCRFLEFPHQLPEYDPHTTILLYPTADAVFLDDPRIDLTPINRVIVIESTWSKSDVVSTHPTLARLQKVKIRDHESTFWRYQELGRNFLSTLEAIYYTCQEFQQRKAATSNGTASSSSSSDSSIDDLMYFYAFQHSLITSRYRDGTEQAPRSWSGGGLDST